MSMWGELKGDSPNNAANPTGGSQDDDDEDLIDLGNFAVGASNDSADEDMLALDELLASHSNVEEAESQDYGDVVPESLASFVRQAGATFQQTQQTFWQDGVVDTKSLEGPDESFDVSPKHHTIQEDEQDIRLKVEVLDRLDSRKQQQQQQQQQQQNDTVLMSPDIMFTPPPNPTAGITDSDAKRQALAETTPMPPPPSSSKPVHINLLNAPQGNEPESSRRLQQQQEEDAAMAVNREVKEDPFVKSSLVQSLIRTSPQLTTSNMATTTTKTPQPTSNTDVPHIGEIQEGPDGRPISTSPGTPQSTPSPTKEVLPPTPSPAVPAAVPQTMSPPVPAPTPTLQVKQAPTPETAASARSNAPIANQTPTQPPRAPARSPAKVTKTPSPVVKEATPSRSVLASRKTPQTAKKTPSPTVPAPARKTTPASATPGSTTTPASTTKSRTPESMSSLDRLSRPTAASAVREKTTPASGNRARSNKTPSPVPTARKTPPPVPIVTTRKTPSPVPRKTPPPVPVVTTRKTPSPVPAARKTPSPVPTRKTPSPVPSRKTTTPSPIVQTRTSASSSSSVDRLSRPTAASAVRKASPTTKRTPPAKPASATKPVEGSSKAPNASNAAPKPVTRAVGTSSRLMQGTAASRARSTPETTPTSTPSPATSEQGRAKARERVRQRKLQQKTKATTTATQGAEAKAQTSRRKTMSADEGIARARERVRQRQLQQKAAIENKNRARSSNAVSSRRTTMASSHPRTVTVPHAPKFATDAKYGEKRVSRSAPPTLAQSSDVFGKGLRHDRAPPSKARSGRPPLTVPKAPKFATTAKYGEKHTNGSARQTPLAQSSDAYAKGLRDDQSVDSVGSTGSRRSLTMPKAPKFATTARHGEKMHTRRASEGDVTLAQSTDVLRKGLRDDKAPASTVKRTPGPTIPHAPRFHQSARRALPQSTAEKEQEMMDYYKSHPIRATPVLTHVPGSARSTKPNKRRLTAPEPFHFQTDARHSSAKQPVASPNKEDTDMEEMKKQFHARPMPSFTQPTKSQAARARTATKATTTPQPFHFASDRRARPEPCEDTTPSDAEMDRKFRARPAPKSTYHAPPPLKSPPVSPSKSNIGPPNLATMNRTEKRQAAADASRRNAEALMRAKERLARLRKREKHAEAILKAETKTPPPNVEPFHLESSLRHEAYQKQLAEKLKEEEAERRRQMDFHAQPFKSPPAPERVRADRRTAPEPFALQSMTRHEVFEQEKREKLAAEEEERRRQAQFKAKPVPKSTYAYKSVSPKATSRELASMKRHEAFEQERLRKLAAEEQERQQLTQFKAKPVPKTTYVYKPISPKTGELVDPFSPQLQSKQRAVERKEFDAYAEREREAEAARRLAMEERQAAEEEEELQERRRLPVSEGGMIPTAEPVNAVFAQPHQE